MKPGGAGSGGAGWPLAESMSASVLVRRYDPAVDPVPWPAQKQKQKTGRQKQKQKNVFITAQGACAQKEHETENVFILNSSRGMPKKSIFPASVCSFMRLCSLFSLPVSGSSVQERCSFSVGMPLEPAVMNTFFCFCFWPWPFGGL